MIMELKLEDLYSEDLLDDDPVDQPKEGPDNDDDNQSNQDDEPSNTNTDDNTDDDTDDAITAYLKSKGIDPNSVKMQNDEGETEEVRFSDLSKEEQLQILNYNPQDKEDPYLMEDEEQLLGILRSNNMSVKDYLNAYRNHVIDEYQKALNAQIEPTYSIDDYSDEELFIADLKSKIPDLTEEDAAAALETEKQNQDLFDKKMAGIRSMYKQREDSLREYQEQQQQAAAQQQAAQFEQIIVDTIQQNNNIDLGDTSLELSEDDMNEIASFILDSDAAGVRHIAKALNDPKMLVEMAWWALKGHEALNQVTQYYKRQIADARRSAKASAATQKATKPRTVVSTPKNNKQSEGKSSNDLYDAFV